MTDAVVSGMVICSSLCKPLEQVCIHARSSGGEIEIFTDPKGQWLLPDRIEEGPVIFSKPGYADKVFDLALPEGFEKTDEFAPRRSRLR